MFIGIDIQFGYNLYINSGRWYLSHVHSTFATVDTHANVFFVFLRGGIRKEWRHIVSANCDPISSVHGTLFRGTPGETKNSSQES